MRLARRFGRRPRLVGAIAILALVAAACGSSGPHSNITSGSLTSANKCTLEIGVEDPAQASAAAAEAAGEGTQTTLAVSTYHAIYSAAINYVNAHGGFHGCKGVPVYYDFNSNGNYQVEGEQECIMMGETHHVLADILTQSDPLSGVTCLAAHHVVSIISDEFSDIPADPALYAKFPDLVYEPNQLDVNRLGAVVTAFHEAGILTSNSKVGLVEYDDGLGSAAVSDNAYETALKKYGISYAPPYTYSLGGTLANQLAELSADSKSVALKFRSEGVNTILLSTGGFVLFFPSYAASQNYYPKYLVTSLLWPGGLGTYNKAAFDKAGAAAFGWLPAVDLPNPAPTSEAPTDSAWKICQSLYVGLPSPGANFSPGAVCDPVLWLAAALKKAPSATPAGLAKGVESLGTSYTSAAGLGPTKYGPGDFDGPVGGKILLWSNKAGAFLYSSSKVYPIPLG